MHYRLHSAKLKLTLLCSHLHDSSYLVYISILLLLVPSLSAKGTCEWQNYDCIISGIIIPYLIIRPGIKISIQAISPHFHLNWFTLRYFSSSASLMKSASTFIGKMYDVWWLMDDVIRDVWCYMDNVWCYSTPSSFLHRWVNTLTEDVWCFMDDVWCNKRWMMDEV